jgi:hypothetical protein
MNTQESVTGNKTYTPLKKWLAGVTLLAAIGTPAAAFGLNNAPDRPANEPTHNSQPSEQPPQDTTNGLQTFPGQELPTPDAQVTQVNKPSTGSEQPPQDTTNGLQTFPGQELPTPDAQ